MNEYQFKPAWWLPNSHLQTLWPPIFRREVKDLVIERECNNTDTYILYLSRPADNGHLLKAVGQHTATGC